MLKCKSSAIPVDSVDSLFPLKCNEAPPGGGGVRFTNSRTIFWIFTNSRTREKWQVSRFQERDFVYSQTTINKYAGIHEFANKFFNFHEFTNEKKPIPACTNIAGGLSNTSYSNIILEFCKFCPNMKTNFLSITL